FKRLGYQFPAYLFFTPVLLLAARFFLFFLTLLKLFRSSSRHFSGFASSFFFCFLACFSFLLAQRFFSLFTLLFSFLACFTLCRCLFFFSSFTCSFLFCFFLLAALFFSLFARCFFISLLCFFLGFLTCRRLFSFFARCFFSRNTLLLLPLLLSLFLLFNSRTLHVGALFTHFHGNRFSFTRRTLGTNGAATFAAQCNLLSLGRGGTFATTQMS